MNAETLETIAIRNYCNRHCSSVEEFRTDFRRFAAVKRLLNRYYRLNDLRERLILNEIVILSNVFGIETTVILLCETVNKKLISYLKPFLIYLNYIRENDLRNVIADAAIVERLKNL